MIIQHNSTNQGAPPARLFSDDSPKVSAPSAGAPQVVAEISEQINARQPSVQQLGKAVETINESMRQSARSLEFSVDPDTKVPVVKMLDTSTGELIRQIPSKEALAVAQSIDQFLEQRGLLLNKKA
ncbi:MAG: flagellar protein FlaG [Gallionellaceae bacterium]|jgi:flagellar protein FlaG|nr:flagellar protein FlaG [Gallionellaceae bacterium]